MKKSCQCHGISGSCTLKTCYKRMPLLDRVQIFLRRKYDKAVRVMGDPKTHSLKAAGRAGRQRQRRQRGGRRRKGRSAGSSPRGVRRRTPNRQLLPESLFFTTPSPNFCKINRRAGVPGTRGRRCDNTHKRRGSCAKLCCGRGYRTIRKQVPTDCNCQFVAVKVICDRCIETRAIHFCR